MKQLILLIGIIAIFRLVDSTMISALLLIGLLIFQYATTSSSRASAFLKILLLLCAVAGAACIPSVGIGWSIAIILGLFLGICGALHWYTSRIPDDNDLAA